MFASGESKVAKMLFLDALHSCISLIIYSLSTDEWSVVLGIEDTVKIKKERESAFCKKDRQGESSRIWEMIQSE